jgi:hypothetical protein
MDSPFLSAQHYLNQAQNMRKLAALEGDEASRNIFLELAKGYEKLSGRYLQIGEEEVALKERNDVKLFKSQFVCGGTGNQLPVSMSRFTVVHKRSQQILYQGNDQAVAEEVFEKAAGSSGSTVQPT